MTHYVIHVDTKSQALDPWVEGQKLGVLTVIKFRLGVGVRAQCVAAQP